MPFRTVVSLGFLTQHTYQAVHFIEMVNSCGYLKKEP